MTFQVLNSQPKGQESLYTFCADYLDQRIEDRDARCETGDTIGDGKLSPTKAKPQKSGFLRREATFNLYSTDSGNLFRCSHKICNKLIILKRPILILV